MAHADFRKLKEQNVRKGPPITFRKHARPVAAPLANLVAGEAPVLTEELVVEGVLTPRDEMIFLLQTAAEIEHSLLVQYLYTAYSIDENAAPSNDERDKASRWRAAIRDIAIEEMAHLISMQNLLLFVGGPTNLERQDFPFRDLFYPFQFKLEPISLDSLAKYVVAEMPEVTNPDSNLQEIINRATDAHGGSPINRVGALFERVDRLFDELSDSDIYPQSAATNQAPPSEWTAYGRRIVRTVETVEQARTLAREIAVQGEGGAASSDSHYAQFRSIYEAFEQTTSWEPALPIPVNPNTAADPLDEAEMEAGRITDLESRRWALISDLQYRLLLYCIAHSLTLDRSDSNQAAARTDVIEWAFHSMRQGLPNAIRHAQSLPQHDPPSSDSHGRERTAGPPFAMPYTLALPHSAAARWHTYFDLIDETQELLEATTTGDSIKTTLFDMGESIRKSAAEHQQAPSRSESPTQPATPPSPSDGSRTRDDFIDVLRSKQSTAQFVHGGVGIPGGGTLSQLFGDEDYDGIIEFLLNADSARPPSSGRRLIVPGSPAKSGFYAQITQGAMQGRFDDREVQVVDDWIRSLPADGGGQGPTSFGIGVASAASPTTLVANKVASGLQQPVFATATSSDPDNLYIVEKGGAIKLLNLSAGQVSATPLLRMDDDISTTGERGLLGLAFHPKFAQNGHFYVNVTDRTGRTTVRRYTKDGDSADLSTRLDILVVDQPFANHNGGWLDFGPNDGFLYIALGDGGAGNDPQNNAQNTSRLLGKMLRIDVEGDDFPSASQVNYSIPASNPFVSDAIARNEIWAYGLRNPWRCSFDSLTGDLWIADVGQSAREELNFQNANSLGGENYGWRVREGSVQTGLDQNIGEFVDPIHEYGRSDGSAIVGGYVYRGAAIAWLQGHYFYADFVSNRIWSLKFDGTSLSDHVERTGQLNANETIAAVSSFGQDAAGELYIVSMLGDIFRIESDQGA